MEENFDKIHSSSPKLDLNTSQLTWSQDNVSISNTLSSSTETEKSFWRRQPAKLPGSIRATNGTTGEADSSMSKFVVGAQHSFAAPLRSFLNSSQSTDANKKNTRCSRPRSRDEFVNATNDAWGDLDDTGSSNESISEPKSQSSSIVPIESKEKRSSVDKGFNANLEQGEAGLVILEKDESYTPTTAKRIAKLNAVLENGTIDLAQLKKQCWTGIPMHLRPICWQLLIGYLPCSADRRATVLAKKRKEYADAVHQYWANPPSEKSIAHQIHIDILRTCPLPMYSKERVQHSLERILYCWAMQHPACGYVQGINDLLTPFFTVFLGCALDSRDIETFSEEELLNIEADSFWCLTKLIDGIQDNYTNAQPGIQKLVSRLREVTQRISPKLYDHLQKENVEYIQFAFRWMNCLLMREVSHHATIRMWDTYLAEGADFSEYHLYICAAFLVKWERNLLEMGFPDILLFLQNPPTKDWTDKEVEAILSQGYVYKNMFESSNHISK